MAGKKTAEEIAKMTDAELEAYEKELQAERDAAVKEEDEDPDGAPGSDKRKGMYNRFKQEETKRKELERQLEEERARRETEMTKLVEAALKGGDDGGDKADPEPAAPTAFDTKDARRRYHLLMKDGDFDKAMDLLEKIDDHQAEVDRYRENRQAWRDRQAEKKIAEAVAEGANKAVTAREAARIKSEVAEVSLEIFEEFPFLDDKSEDRDEDAINAVVARRNVLIGEGMSPARALKKAAAEKGPRFAKLQPGYEEGDDDKKDDKGSKGKGDGESRQDRIRRLTEAAAKGTPPNPVKGTKGTRDTGKKKVSELTDEQLKNMPDEELAKYDGRARFAAESAD